MTPEPRLTTADVLRLYSIKTERAARRVMAEAGGFKVAGRMVLRVADLDRYERERQAESPPVGSWPSPTARRRTMATPAGRNDLANLSPDFWRD